MKPGQDLPRDNVVEQTKEACSTQLKNRSKLLAFPLSFWKREQNFRKSAKAPTSRTRGYCNVAIGYFGFYRSLFLVLQDQNLVICKSEDQVDRPMHEIFLVGGSLSVVAWNKFTIKTAASLFWFKFESTEQRDQWLRTLQHVPGLYRKVTDFYDIGETCGEGATCHVQRCTNKLTGNCLAFKSRVDQYDELGRQGMYNELRILQILAKNRHPTIPVLEDYFFDKSGDIKLVMGHMNGGDLLTLIQKDRRLDEKRAREIFRQIAEGVCHLHENCIAHRDIKPTNIMLTKDSDQQIHCKIIDYDLAKENYAEHWFAQDPCGTAEFMAPEIVERQPRLTFGRWVVFCTACLQDIARSEVPTIQRHDATSSTTTSVWRIWNQSPLK